MRALVVEKTEDGTKASVQEIDEGRLAPIDVQVTGELLARLVLSFFLTAHSVVPLATLDEARRFARVYLAPALRAASADA